MNPKKIPPPTRTATRRRELPVRRPRPAGSVYQRRDGRWVVSVNLPSVGAGKRRRQTFYVENQQAGLERLEAYYRLSRQIEKLSPKSDLSTFLRVWLEAEVAPSLREKTTDNYRVTVETNIVPYSGKTVLTDLTPERLSSMYAAMEGHVSAATRRRIHEVLHRALGRAVAWELIDRNPCKMVTKPAREGRGIRILSANEVHRFVQEAEKSRAYALYVLALLTGLRLGELFGLKWRDINVRRRTISVSRAVVDIRGRRRLANLKTDGSARVVELPKFALAVLAFHRQRMAAEGVRSEFVFVSKAKTLYSRANFHKVSFKPLLKRAKLPSMRFHDLRHNSATILLAMKVHPKVVARRLGHVDIATTLDVYSHLADMSQAPALELLGKLGQRVACV